MQSVLLGMLLLDHLDCILTPYEEDYFAVYD